MRRLFTVCLFTAIGTSTVHAQQSSGANPLPPAMQRAINRILAGTPNPPPVQLHNPPPALAARACSVPLLEMRVEHPERFPIGTTLVPKSGDPMPAAQAPAPPCNAAQPAKRP